MKLMSLARSRALNVFVLVINSGLLILYGVFVWALSHGTSPGVPLFMAAFVLPPALALVAMHPRSARAVVLAALLLNMAWAVLLVMVALVTASCIAGICVFTPFAFLGCAVQCVNVAALRRELRRRGG